MATQQRLDDLFTKYYESDLKNMNDLYDECCEKYNIQEKKNFRLLKSYPTKQTLSISAIRKAISNEIKAITPKEVIEGAKKRTIDRKLKEKEKKKRKYQKSHGHVCEKCGGKDFIGIYHKYNDGGHCVLPSGREVDGSPSLAGICDSDQMLMEICVDCGTIFGLNVATLKRQLANYENDHNDEAESSTDEVFDYGAESNDESDDESEEEFEEKEAEEEE